MVTEETFQKEETMDPIHALCVDAVATIERDVLEGLVGTTHVGLHVIIMLADENKIVYQQGFGSALTRDGVSYATIAKKKAELVFEERTSLSDLIANPDLPGLAGNFHNGGFYCESIIVAVAGAGHLGNVAYGRKVLVHLSSSPLLARAAQAA